MFSNVFIPEAECEALLKRIRDIMDDDCIFAFEKVEDIERLLRDKELRYAESTAHIY